MAFAYAEQATWSGNRFVALLGATAVNLGFILALSNGLDFRIDKVVIPPIIATVVDPPVKEKIKEVPVPQEAVEPKPEEVTVPAPLFPIEFETTEVITAPVEPQPVAPISPPATELQADRALTAPVYPTISRKLEEQGTVTLMIHVLPDGRVGDVRVARSSGYPRLDEAAMSAARKGWHFKPATRGGGAVAAWGRYAVTFSLKD